eukprot:TRINITY_DN1506_c0_g2_i2.p1 TRINITY_DN1506_c0_g2~~TRINITY_DN1506_c0_g2_i2.p1  ORF type:complete len:696 (-),score=110.83 TRINITY_DN1506_c0_g2_i2:1056-3143(-)
MFSAGPFNFNTIDILPLCGPPEVQHLRHTYRIKKLKWEEVDNTHPHHDKLTAFQLPCQGEVISQRQNSDSTEAEKQTGEQKDEQFALTENRAVAYSTSQSACLDFFYQVLPGANDKEISNLLQNAWEEDAELCLKLIFQLGSTRKGKADRFSFYHALYWLYKNHPATLLENLHVVQEAVYFKALIELLAFMVEGDKQLYQRRQLAIQRKIATKGISHRRVYIGKKGREKNKCASQAPLAGGRGRGRGRLAGGSSGGPVSYKIEISKKLDFNKDQREHQTYRVLKKYDFDAVFRTAHNIISEHFAKFLRNDLDNMRNGQNSCSLASKWVPGLTSGYENRTLLCEGIARRLFPKTLPEYENLSEQHYSYRIRDRLRKEVLVPLHQYSKIPEIYMTDGKWNELDYKRVASVCMRLRKPLFFKHDEARFKQFLGEVKKGEKKIVSGALQPHEILRDVINARDADSEDVAQLQWDSLVQKLKSEGNLTNCVAVCDVSGSMHCESRAGVACIEVATSLTLLVSEVASEPWNNHAITFSASPQFQKIQGNSLKDRYSSLEKFDWDMNTDFQKVFDEILQRSQQALLEPSEMVSTLFVFSDMQFDQAQGMYNDEDRAWKSSHQLIRQKFQNAGYPMPNIVYWNLRQTNNAPVQKDETGTCLLSGYSANLLKLVMDDKLDEYNPAEMMHQAVSNPLFQQLKVVD